MAAATKSAFIFLRTGSNCSVGKPNYNHYRDQADGGGEDSRGGVEVDHGSEAVVALGRLTPIFYHAYRRFGEGGRQRSITSKM